MSKGLNFIKADTRIFEALSQRKSELNLTYKDIALDAQRQGFSIPPSSLSSYFSGKSQGGEISEYAIRWLCARYCVDLALTVTKDSYSESQAKINLKILFPTE